MDESLLKSNFVGRDGFRWWIGQIPPTKDQAGGKQVNGPGWGNRSKVRIMGYHPTNEEELSNEDLPWAQVLIPPTAGSGGGNRYDSLKLAQGDVVFGFFLDGDNAQIPVIMGSFGRTKESNAAGGSKNYKTPFVPFTGYNDNIKKPPNTVLSPEESGDQNAAAQKSPRHVAPSQASGIGSNEVSYSSVIGDKVKFASASPGSTISKINSEVENLLNFIQNVSTIVSSGGDYLQDLIAFEIQRVTKKIQDVVSGLVNGMVNKLYKALAPLINQGLKMLYNLVYNLVLAATGSTYVAHLAGVAAQEAMVNPVLALQQAIPSLANTIIEGLGGLISSILTSVVGNLTRFTTCAANQFTGVLANSVIGQVSNSLEGPISGISQITQFFGGFSVDNTMRTSSELLGGFGELANAGQSPSNFESSVNEWIIGRGPKNAKTPSITDILGTANDAFALANSVGSAVSGTQALVNGFDNFATSAASPDIGECYSGPPLSYGAPKVNIFGSNGSGASAVAIMGNVVGEGRDRTGSVIGINITNPGSGYDFPPFIEIEDDGNQGYGAIGRAVLNGSGQIDYIYVVSEGENYPVGELGEYVLTGVKVVDPGLDYNVGDTVVDNLGNTYTTQIDKGGIFKVIPDKLVNITELPVLTVISDEGSGAILQPIIDTRTAYLDRLDNNQLRRGEVSISELQQSIDCITK